MNKKKVIMTICIILVIIICSFIAILYLTQDSQPPKTTSIGSGDIYFNPETIMVDLESDVPVFDKEIEYKSGENDPDISNDVKVFSDDEFMKIVYGFFNIHWDDEISDWDLVGVNYMLYDCNKGMSGIVLVDYDLEKKMVDKQNTIYKRSISVLPWVDTISWYEKMVEFTSLSSEIDWNKVTITASDAFQISKDYGDGHLEDGWGLSCDEVSLHLVNKSKNIWYIDYRAPDDLLLSVEINAETGKLKEK